MNELKLAFRQFLKRPGSTLIAVATLALGIGATAAIYSTARLMLFEPIPGKDPDALVQFGEWFIPDFGEPMFSGITPPVLAALRGEEDRFESLAWSDSVLLDRRTDEFSERVQGILVSPNLFTMLGVGPMLGRVFAPGETPEYDRDDKPIGPCPIILSHASWQSWYGGDRSILGRTIELSDCKLEVVGVMPPHFKFPSGGADFWIPAPDPKILPNETRGPNTLCFARLKPGDSVEALGPMISTLAARVRVDNINDTWQGRHGYGDQMSREGWALLARPARQLFADESLSKSLFGLLGATGFVLLIVCANIANLMLARTEGRQKELSVRAALGAGRFRLVRQLLAESLLLSVIGGLGSLATAAVTFRLLETFIPRYMPQLREISLDGTFLALSFAVSLGAGVLFGMASALKAWRTPVDEVLKSSGPRATGGRAWRYLREGLVVTEVAVAIVLLSGAGLMVKSVSSLLNVPPGFNPDQLLRVYVNLPWGEYASDRVKSSRVLGEIQERLAALPGVRKAGIEKMEFDMVEPYVTGPADRKVDLLRMGAGFEESDPFEAMEVPLLAGRSLTREDVLSENAPEFPVVINQTAALRCWPGQEVLGQTFRRDREGDKSRYRVVGVVGDFHRFRYDEDIKPLFFRPYPEFYLQGVPPVILLRTSGDPTALFTAIRRELKAAEPAMLTPRFEVVREALQLATAARRSYMNLLVGAAAVGLLLASLGIYGVLAYSVAVRTREIGIRMAVGARRGQVLGMLLAEGGRLVGLGVVIGLGATFWLTRFIQSQLFQVSPTEPVVFLSVVVFLVTVAMVACGLPARRAARLDPMEALRTE